MPSEKLGEGSMSSNWENRAREGRQSWRLTAWYRWLLKFCSGAHCQSWPAVFLGTVLLRTRTRRLYYNGELQGLAKANLWELALALLQSLPTKKVRPDKAGRAMWI